MERSEERSLVGHWPTCPAPLQSLASRFAGSILFKHRCRGSTEYHEQHNYKDLRETTDEHPSGVFCHKKHVLHYHNDSGQPCTTTLHTTSIQQPTCKSINLPHNNHLVYFLGANSVFEYKIADIKTFARTGLTVHAANYPVVKNCFADLVWQGYFTVKHIMEYNKARPDQIVLIGDSFGGAVAEYVFVYFYQRGVTLGGRIISNSFNDFRTAIDDFARNDPSGFCANLITYGLVKPLILKSWNAAPLASTNICPPLLFMSNREGDATLAQSQLTAHAANQCGFLDFNLAEKYHLKKEDVMELFPATPDRLPTSTLQRLHWATCVLDHHTRLKMRHDLPPDRVQQIHGNAHDILYSECDPIRAQDLPSGHKEPSNPHLENGCVSGPHNTTEMMEAFLTLSLFYHAQCKIKRTMQSLGWKVATRIAHKRKSSTVSIDSGRLTL